VHDQSFVFVLFLLYWGVELVAPPELRRLTGWTVGLYLPYYLYRSMRRLYVQGRLLTIGKLAVLVIAYFVAALAALLATLLYSAVTL